RVRVWRVIDEAYLADSGRQRGRHVGKAVYGLDWQAVLFQPRYLLFLGVERDRIGAMHQPVGELPAITCDRYFLIDIELFYEGFAELQIKARRLTEPAASDRGIVGRNLAAPFRVEQTVRGVQLAGFDGARVDVKCGTDGVEQAQDEHVFGV